MQKTLKYRMYFFVPYNISPIQQAIQAGHAGMEYVHSKFLIPEVLSFMENDKTWIILNGGTTNDTYEDTIPKGTLNQIRDELQEHKINISCFYEPDLNDALTAVCFLADERVWDYENYPDFRVYMKDKLETIAYIETFKNDEWTYEDMMEKFPKEMKDWINLMGGKKTIFLRDLIRYKKLA